METRCKVIVLGRTGVGKTSLLTFLRKQTFECDEARTMGIEQFQLRKEVQGQVVVTDIWDTCGQERFRSIGKNYYKGSYGALLVFDLTDRESLAALPRYLEDFKQLCDVQGAICVLIGTKVDLPEEREVTFKDATAFAQTYGIRYFETSAKTGQNLEAALEPILLAVLTATSVKSLSIVLSPQLPKTQSRSKCKC